MRAFLLILLALAGLTAQTPPPEAIRPSTDGEWVYRLSADQWIFHGGWDNNVWTRPGGGPMYWDYNEVQPAPPPTETKTEPARPVFGKSWGLHLHLEAMRQHGGRYGLIVGTDWDLGIEYSYRDGGWARVVDRGALEQLRRDFPNAEIFMSVHWREVPQGERSSGNVPLHLLRGTNSGVGFQSRRLDYLNAQAEIAAITLDLCREGISVMLDWMAEDEGQGAIAQLVSDIAHAHGCRVLFNANENGPFNHLADIVDREVWVDRQDHRDVTKWGRILADKKPGQTVYFRPWVDNEAEATWIIQTYGHLVDVFQFESSPRTESTDDGTRLIFHP